MHNRCKEFQFQYGAIKRMRWGAIRLIGNLFQFQYGAIKSVIVRVSIILSCPFQFQYGAIKRIAFTSL